jgi:predicted restriction endonuclease
MARGPWSRDELLVAFNLYCRTPFGQLHRNNNNIIRLAGLLQRTPSAVAMKLCNFASLDPAHQSRNVAGLKNAARADRDVFREFWEDWTTLAAESEMARQRLGLALQSDVSAEEATVPTLERDTDVERVVRGRRLQALFRSTVMASYDLRCAISGINVPELLQASHIIPWAVDERRRLDPRNGIALSALHDRAFDRGLITLDEDCRVVISGKLRVGNPSEIHWTSLLRIEGQRISLPCKFAPDPEAIDYHRQHVFIG